MKHKREPQEKDIHLLMGASALIHYHIFGEVPFGRDLALAVFTRYADYIKEEEGLKTRPSPDKVAQHIAGKLANRLCDGSCKGLTMPTPLFFGWFSFLPGGYDACSPCTGKIPVETIEGEKYKLHIDIDEKGKGSIYRYHDPESNSTLIGQEHYLRIAPFVEMGI